MAIVHRATLIPSKTKLLVRWLPIQPWFRKGGPTNLGRVGSFRFDDPDGEIGIETLIVESESAVFQVPLTYRGAPLQGADPSLIGTLEHSLLGKRWVYDATGDPVYASALAAAILTGQPQAHQSFELDGRLEAIPESVHLQSTGTPGTSIPIICSVVPDSVDGVTTIHAEELDLSVSRVLNLISEPFGQRLLTATWDEQTIQVQLASVDRV